jgi:hypothetical protein
MHGNLHMDKFHLKNLKICSNDLVAEIFQLDSEICIASGVIKCGELENLESSNGGFLLTKSSTNFSNVKFSS